MCINCLCVTSLLFYYLLSAPCIKKIKNVLLFFVVVFLLGRASLVRRITVEEWRAGGQHLKGKRQFCLSVTSAFPRSNFCFPMLSKSHHSQFWHHHIWPNLSPDDILPISLWFCDFYFQTIFLFSPPILPITTMTYTISREIHLKVSINHHIFINEMYNHQKIFLSLTSVNMVRHFLLISSYWTTCLWCG